jgi:hypothetical protein
MSGYDPSLCSDPGPGEAHCTELRMHRYSCYDASEDVSWNDGQFKDGWFEGNPHACDNPACPGRPTEPAAALDPPCPDCGNDPDDWSLHRDGCRRILPIGHPLERMQFGPPYVPAWEPWTTAAWVELEHARGEGGAS